MAKHEFSSQEIAYGACQCDENIKTGDTLIVADDKVVGLAWAWPLTVAGDPTELHRPNEKTGATMEGMLSLLADAGITLEQVEAAISEAETRGWPILPEFQHFKS